MVADAVIGMVGGALIPMLGLIPGLGTAADYAEVLNLGAQGAEASLSLSRFDWRGSRKEERWAALILAFNLTCTALASLDEGGLSGTPLGQELGERIERLARIYADATWDAIDAIDGGGEGDAYPALDLLALPKGIDWNLHPALALVTEARSAFEEAVSQIAP